MVITERGIAFVLRLGMALDPKNIERTVLTMGGPEGEILLAAHGSGRMHLKTALACREIAAVWPIVRSMISMRCGYHLLRGKLCKPPT